MMNNSFEIVIWAISLILSVFFSAMETAFVSSDKLRYALDKKNTSPLDYIQHIFFTNPRKFLATLSVGNFISLIFFVYTSIVISHNYVLQNITSSIFWAYFLEFIFASFIILFAGELLPRAIFKNNSNLWVKIFAFPAFVFFLIFYPVIYLFTLIGHALFRLLGVKINLFKEKTLGRIELDTYVKQGIDEMPTDGGIDAEVKIFRNALDFSSVKLRDCMVPRTDIIAVSKNTDIEELKDTFIETGFSKILVYEDDVDDIIGYIHIWEMFSIPADWTTQIATISFYPESMLAKTLLGELIQQRKTIAVVVDEFGGTSGVITMEDLVEEIFGDIQDEYDVNTNIAKKLASNHFRISGRIEIEELNELFNLKLPIDDEYSTIAGFILHHIQRFPKMHETIEIGNYTFKISKVTARKIEIVELFINQNNL